MNILLAALLVPLHFTAPADVVGLDAKGASLLSPYPVHAYVFHEVDASGVTVVVPGYADSLGSAVLTPHAPGARETVWLSPGPSRRPVTITMLSVDVDGNVSAPSNPCVIAGAAPPAPLPLRRSGDAALQVPLIAQSREHCGQAALAMVLSFYGAPTAAVREADSAYDPALRGSLITDLAAAARRAGYSASVATLTPDSLIDLLSEGVPPIVLYQNGAGPVTFPHFGVVTGWDAAKAAFTLNDGRARPRVARRDELAKQWETAGSQALIVRPREP